MNTLQNKVSKNTPAERSFRYQKPVQCKSLPQDITLSIDGRFQQINDSN